MFYRPKQTSRWIYRQEIRPVSWEAELSLCVCFLLTLQLIFNRTRAESFTLLLHSLAILISHTHLCPPLSSHPVRSRTFPLTSSALSRYIPRPTCLRGQSCEKPVDVHLLTFIHPHHRGAFNAWWRILIRNLTPLIVITAGFVLSHEKMTGMSFRRGISLAVCD